MSIHFLIYRKGGYGHVLQRMSEILEKEGGWYWWDIGVTVRTHPYCRIGCGYWGWSRIQNMRRILTMKGMLRIEKIQRMRGILGRIFRGGYWGWGRIQRIRRILTVRGMLRIGRIQRMRGDTKDGENIQGRILRMRGILRIGRIFKGGYWGWGGYFKWLCHEMNIFLKGWLLQRPYSGDFLALKILIGSRLWFCKIYPEAAFDKLIPAANERSTLQRTSTNHKEGNSEEVFSTHFQK